MIDIILILRVVNSVINYFIFELYAWLKRGIILRSLHISNDYNNSKVYEKLHFTLLANKIDNYFFVPTYIKYSGPLHKNVVHSNSFRKIDRFFYYYKQNKIFNELVKYVQEIKPSLLHGHFVFSSGYLCLKIKQMFNIPYLVTVQNTDLNVFFKYMIPLRFLGLKILLNADTIIFINSAYKDSLLKKYIPKKYHEEIIEKIEIIPFGIDSYWLENKNSPKEVPTKKLNIITVGVINKNKNQLSVARAIQLLNNNGYEISYTLIGDVLDEAVYEELKDYKFIKFEHHQPKEMLIKHYRTADIFVLTSIHESFGLVYAEAMSQALPLIYSKGQGFDEQFKVGEVGYPVEASNYEEIAAKIELIINKYDEISKKSLRNCDKFNWDNIVLRYISIYKKMTQ